MSAENTFDKLAGKAKEAAGKATDNERLQAEGQTDQAQAGVKEKVEDAKGAVEGIKDSFNK
ncbi:CsbD family protein [Microbacterium foliorum]|uniref:CsbD family protein n=1 Tax=Rothia terrae TaxID=396015 RepID=A0A7H2BDP4_9MICC|nr:CsbD family protein [Rothia terrae]MDT0190572.1 CsbD family protein [Rothia terrae]NKZ34621.1 CsbD family protein [Rothia terrae]QNV37790.1 CsbD family protein [Rothia terrae]